MFFFILLKCKWHNELIMNCFKINVKQRNMGEWERNVRNRGNRRTSPEREEDEMSESLHSALVENLFDEEEALLNLHMNVIQGTYVRTYVCAYVSFF